MKGTTSSGFRFNSNDKIVNDWRFIKTLTTIEKGDEVEKLYASSQLITLLLGDKGEAALCRHVAEKDGTVPTDKLMKEAGEILRLMRGSIKNS